MDYSIYKLDFPTGAHFGKGALETTDLTVYADVLFSALCIEAVRKQGDLISSMVKSVGDGELLFSDLMPFTDDAYYLPKPLLTVDSKAERGDSVVKKAYKKLKYIPVESVEDYLSGNMDISCTAIERSFGREEVKVSAAIGEGKDTLPYRIGTFHFNKGSGLYFILGYENAAIKDMIDGLIESLSYSGLGGRRSSGLGHFMPVEKRLTDGLSKLLKADAERYMTISVSLPSENEMESVLSGASYQMIKRSGFVSSDNYSDTFQRKKDFYALAAGSVFTRKYDGGVYDVSSRGNHPVWRYAKPMFIGI